MTSTSHPVVVRPVALDWIKYDAQLARNGNVDPVDKALYAALASFVDQGSREATGDPDSDNIPTRKRLAACIGRSVKTVDRSTARLEELGLVEVERRRDPDNPKSNLPSVYKLLDVEVWDERAAERAEKRRAERAARKPKRQGVGTPVSPPWGHECPHPGDTSDAVPSPSQEGLSQEGTPAPTGPKNPQGPQGEARESSSVTDLDARATKFLLGEVVSLTTEQARAYVAHLRSKGIDKPLAYMRKLKANDDLSDDVTAWTAKHRPSGSQKRVSGACTIHAGEDLPCLSCKGDLAAGGPEAQEVIDLYLSNPEARPDLKNNRYILRALETAESA